MIEPFSGASLPKTGIFAVLAGDFHRIPPTSREIGSTETGRRMAKPAIGGPFFRY
jgi:hypothetical protein